MIEVQAVSKSFDGFKALDGLSMTVPTGAIYGLVGPNGAGKSTILRHITGVYQQDSGLVLVDGQTVYECPVKENGEATTCYYCVCGRMSNYEIAKRRVEKDFLKYDPKVPARP